ncbi:MAG: DNA adenine methylase [Anabaena sp. CoA2_C59]|jgi:DNA adenine methylase|uniref:Site-specific DNA-methyltransferase (adenine-specific) n=2 Tax=Aphanizomenon flos-aquae TaxID=1176 RepID=A0A1B7X4E0_APHFL|nr:MULTISPECIES: DNA adenine methylase [Aphanizomenon]MCE2904757.1 DNA adenine methylase [Anabaena sp. CoA2_C59]MDJ0505809.1 DNA adenine methylase [Nostocales cyanobacterium LE14-WE12]OBQ18200.1 MAG: DNA methyltransferase [Anabaena sp. WA113]OBQ44231.1 MAG: DNA methyltransferase [Aphanizomenon flos-aquae WA102]MBD2389978.1 DNA adenine methylase [Aphanizomenon flos-aquae FACHB-1171]
MVLVNPLVKPFVKWAGGKRQLVPTILANHLPKNYNLQTYYEPFIGGGALLFSLQPKKAVINDSNAELINCYKIIKNSLDELIEDLKNHKNNEYYYYDIRDWDREKNFKSKTEVQRASRIIFLNKTCYNGLFRVNSQGQFNVPFGKYKNPNILDIAVLKAVNKYLNENQVRILNSDFQEAVKDAKGGDFIYLDPPYDPVSETASFTGYDVNGFNKQEQRRLKEVFDDLNSRGCHILLSNACTEFIEDLYKDYLHTKISAIRAINCNGKKRGKVDEILVKNYE